MTHAVTELLGFGAIVLLLLTIPYSSATFSKTTQGKNRIKSKNKTKKTR